jgi:hypothetical protein
VIGGDHDWPYARILFAIGIGAAILASAVLPLSTAYSISEFIGHEGALDDGFRGAPFFYGSYLAVAELAMGIVLVPGMPLIGVLVLTQVFNRRVAASPSSVHGSETSTESDPLRPPP